MTDERTVDERFRELARDPRLEDWLATPPGGEGAARIDGGCLVAALISALVLAGLLTLVSALFFPPLAFLPIAVVLVGGLSLLGRRRRAPWEAQPLESGLARVEETRTDLTGDRASAARTRVRARLRFADGTERDVDVLEEAERETSTGAYGVAYLRGLWLVGFRRLEG